MPQCLDYYIAITTASPSRALCYLPRDDTDSETPPQQPAEALPLRYVADSSSSRPDFFRDKLCAKRLSFSSRYNKGGEHVNHPRNVAAGSKRGERLDSTLRFLRLEGVAAPGEVLPLLVLADGGKTSLR